MTDGLKPYTAYKNSGVPWLGDIPEQWEVRKLRNLLRENAERNRADLPLLSVVREKGVIVRNLDESEDNHNFIPDDLSNYKVVRKGQFAMNKMKAWQGSYGISSYNGIVSPAYFVFILRDVRSDFFHATIRSNVYVQQFNRASEGVRIGQWDLSKARMREIEFCVPPVSEQESIARFLNGADTGVRRLIRTKQKLIKLLEEERRTIIYRAVSRGLDASVRFKKSGVPWLGDIPEQWEVSRVKNEFYCLNRQRAPLNSTERGAMISRTYDYYGASGVIDKVDNFIFADDLLLIAEDGANLVLRNLPLAIIARGQYWVNNHAHILKPKRGNLEYLAAVMEGLNYQPWISGAAQPKLTQDRLMSITIAVPPVEEQERIIARAEQETASLRLAIERSKTEIVLLWEFRSRLIADVVTGKLDVREAALRLPEEVAEPEPLDEINELSQDDRSADNIEPEAVEEI